MVDFMAGCMGLDPAGDDGRKYGRWPWQIEGWPSPTGAAETAPAAAPRESAREAPRERPKPRPTEAPEKRTKEPSKRGLEDLVP
jgi:hypothetical protein